jgi:hypothetical protein
MTGSCACSFSWFGPGQGGQGEQLRVAMLQCHDKHSAATVRGNMANTLPGVVLRAQLCLMMRAGECVLRGQLLL